MSAACTAAVWDMDLPANDKIVLLKLADVADDDGQSIYMAQDTIAKQCGCSVRTVKRIFKKYTDTGLLKMVSPAGSMHKAATWQIMVTQSHVPESHVPQSHPMTLRGDSKRSPRGVTLDSMNNPGDSYTTLQKDDVCLGDCMDAFDAFIAVADKHKNIPKPRDLTVNRQKLLRQRLEDAGGLSGWQDVLAQVQQSSFLTGEAGQWVINFDWLCKQANFNKVREGNYHDRSDAGANRTKRQKENNAAIYSALRNELEDIGTDTAASDQTRIADVADTTQSAAARR
ncbi:putative DNA binding protein [uncultured Mediterranean phage uvMED]|nr:putative DNA binding protein [uncultured Mediterranean phage uvMED]